MNRCLRQIAFVTFSLILQWPALLLFWILGRFGVFKTIFLIYPTDRDECLDFSPDIKILRDFYSGRPTPSGLIMKGFMPVGIYFLVPNTALELCRKKNRYIVDNIMRRLLFFQKLTGARTIGLAGQLGPIFEKHLGEPLKPPFYISKFGNVFSIRSAVNHISKVNNLLPYQVNVSILGGGELAELLVEELRKDSYLTQIVGVKYTRKGAVTLADEALADKQLRDTDLIVNLLPRGKDFLDCSIHNRAKQNAFVVDFSRPQLVQEQIPQRLFTGNRVQSNGLRFITRLPGGWKPHEIPACAMPCILASLGSIGFSTTDEFRVAANNMNFLTSLKDVREENVAAGVLAGSESYQT